VPTVNHIRPYWCRVMIPTLSLCPRVPRKNDEQALEQNWTSDLSLTLCPSRKDRQTQTKPDLRPPPFCAPGENSLGHNRGTQNAVRTVMAACGHIWPEAAALQRLLQFHCGWTWVGHGLRNCGSHGRGPRFDPLCAHHASPFGLRWHCQPRFPGRSMSSVA
jgi:hypothetical protein